MQRIEKHVGIEAPRSVVWEALTNPVSLRQWTGLPEMRIEIASDWQVGGPMLITGFHHAAFENKGTILRLDPEAVLCYTHLSSLSRLPDEPKNYSTLCFALAAEAARTSVTLTIDNFPTEAIYKHLNFYWGTALELLKKYAEQRRTAGNG